MPDTELEFQEFDSRKDSHSTKFDRRPQIFIKLSFRELCNSKLSGLQAFDNMAKFIKSKKIKNSKAGCEFMMMMMNYFCDVVDRRKTFSLISSRDHRRRSSPSRISNTSQAGFEPVQNLSSGLV